MGTVREKRICRVAAKFLARAGLFDIEDVTEPDVPNRVSPDIDLEFSVIGQRYFLEHTLVENVPGQTTASKKWTKRFAEASAALNGNTPPHAFLQVRVEHDAPIGSKRAEKARIDAALLAWITERAPIVAAGLKVAKIATEERAPCSHVPFKCTLVAHGMPDGADLGGKTLFVAHWPMDPLEGIQRSVRKAIDEKCPKLRDAKLRGVESYGPGVSALVCEAAEFCDPMAIADVLDQSLYRRSFDAHDCPDVAVVVWPWVHSLHFLRVKDGGDWLHENPDWIGWDREWGIDD